MTPRIDKRLTMKAILALALGAALSACVGPMQAPTPMRSIEYANPAQPARCLFVLLPGMGDHAEAFQQRGFVEELRAHGLSADIRATDATFGYYMRGTFIDRLSTDVIAPAKQRGYEETWLVGPSMGGFGSLFYSRMRTSDVTGVLAIAPFLGDKDVIEEIVNAGGLRKWTPPPRVETPDRSNYQRELWRWLQAATQSRERAPLIFAGYGRDDRLGRADELLTAELPPQRVFLTDGAHEWPAWRRILAAFLESPDFAGHCRAATPAAPASPASAATADEATDAAACAARGGAIRPVCRRQIPRCLVPFADAGKACTDNSQCQGKCLVDSSVQNTGPSITGRCQTDDDPCGCKIEVVNGKPAGGRCVD
ncbi:MAG TPA: hypothetical protein VMF52_20470 [Steroidobacteraceae bacterium]|nr:hypothetical protein [Steroidobacteraceae bacterium]